MEVVRRHPVMSAVGAVGLVLAVTVLAMALYLASKAGELPWQEDPTRIPVTPFADIPGFTLPTKVPTTAASTEKPIGTPTP
jgi:hypothetical protein